MFDTFQEIFASLRRSKLRTALTGVSVSVGIFLLIVLLGAGNGIIHAFENVQGTMAQDVLNIYSGSTRKAFAGMPEGRSVSLDTRDHDIAARNFSDVVRATAPVITKSGTTLRNESRSLELTITGVVPEYAGMIGAKGTLAAGRFVNENDLRQMRKVIIMSQQNADFLFGAWQKALNKPVRVDSSVYRIVGIYRNVSMDSNDDMFVPYTTLRTVTARGTRIDNLALKTEGIATDDDVDRFAARYRNIAGRVHLYAPDDEGAVYMNSSAAGAAESRKAMNILRTALWVIGILTLLSGVVSISNIMLITVRERTHEFGIRKALGARPGSILRSVMLESIIITTFFGYTGMVLGVAATEYLNVIAGQYSFEVDGRSMTVFSNPTVDMLICFEALAVMITAGIVAGLIPARKAVKIKPIEALRAE